MEPCTNGSIACSNGGTCYKGNDYEVLCFCNKNFYGIKCENECSSTEQTLQIAIYSLVGLCGALLLFCIFLLLVIYKKTKNSQGDPTQNLQPDTRQRGDDTYEKGVFNLASNFQEKDEPLFMGNGHARLSDSPACPSTDKGVVARKQKQFDSVASREGQRKSLDSLGFPRSRPGSSADLLDGVEMRSSTATPTRSRDLPPNPQRTRYVSSGEYSLPGTKRSQSSDASLVGTFNGRLKPGTPGTAERRSPMTLQHFKGERSPRNVEAIKDGRFGHPRTRRSYDASSESSGPSAANRQERGSRSLENVFLDTSDLDEGQLPPWSEDGGTPDLSRTPNARANRRPRPGIWARTKMEGY